MWRAIEILGLALLLAASVTAGVLSVGERWVSRAVLFFLAGAWALAGILLGAAYCSRFRGRVADYFKVGITSAFLLILPLLPFFWQDRRLAEVFPVTLMVMSVFGGVVSATFRQLARYLLSNPAELSEGTRQAAGEVLGQVGLRAISMSVAPRGYFESHAWVWGLRTCVVVVGHRAAGTFTEPELAALVAQEASRVKRGGILRSLAPVPAALLCLNAVALLRPASNWLLFGGALGVLICLATLNLQRERLAGVRLAARLTTAAHTASMIRKVHADLPVSLSWVQKSTLLAPFLWKPPLAVQLAKAAGGGARAVAAYRAVWGLALLGFFVAPWGTLLAARLARAALPAPVAWACAALPASYLVGFHIVGLARIHGIQASQATSAPRISRGRWIRVFILLSLVNLLAFLLAGSFVPQRWRVQRWLGVDTVVTLVTLLALLVIGRRWGAFKSTTDDLPRRCRKAVVGAVAALTNGRPEEALALLEAVPPRWRPDPWLVTLRATCLLRLGRLDEARRELDELVSREESYTPAVRDLCIVELLAGNLPAAEDLADRLARLAPRDPFAWELGGLVALESGELEEADRRFARACDLGGEIAGARAGRALVAIARGSRLEEAAGWIELARSQEPSSPLVLLAEAGWRQGRGELEEARARFAEAVFWLEVQGRKGWIPFHEKFGRRWGLLDAADGEPGG